MALPGVKTVLQDRFYSLARTDSPGGPRIAVIGRRDTVPGSDLATPSTEPDLVRSYSVYNARSEQNVITQFGKGSDLHKAFLELLSGGASRVYLIALPADTTQADLDDVGEHSVFEKAFNEAETLLPDFIVPYGRGGNETDWDDFYTPATPGPTPKWYGFHADNDVAAGVSMARRVSNKVKEISERSNPCMAVLGVKPWLGQEPMSAADIAEHIKLTKLTDRNTPALDSSGYDKSHNLQYVSVVATEIQPSGYPVEFGWANGACTYAGFISGLRANQSSTNKTILNIQDLRYNVNRVQRNDITELGAVAVGLDFTRAPLWVDGVTFARDESDYKRLTTMRIVFETMSMVRNVSQKFIGEPATLENRNAFETGITSGLRGFQQTGGLLASDFIVSYYPRDSTAKVDLVIQPAFELRNIDVTISVNF